MSYVLGRQVLSELWSALQKSDDRSFRSNAQRVLIEIANAGQARLIDLEDVLWDADPRLYGVDVAALTAGFKLPWRIIYPRPEHGEREVWGRRMLAAADAAAFFILMAEIGFRLDPAPLVERLLPSIRAKPEITDAELMVLWSTRDRGRKAITLQAEACTSGATSWPKFKTPAGHQAQMNLNEEGAPLYMEVVGPRYRRRRSDARLVDA